MNLPICLICQRLRPEKKCEAFPDGIPEAIWLSEADHRNPYFGDNGVQFKAEKKDE